MRTGWDTLVHIGMQKTGTSAIQVNLDRYDDGRTRYARLLEPNHSLALQLCFMESPMDVFRKHVPMAAEEDLARARARARRALERELQAHRQKRLVLSGEGLGALSQREVRCFLDFLAQQGRSEPQVVAYVREPHSYTSSCFAQDIKTGRAGPHPVAPSYRSKLESWTSTVPPDRMTFKLYHRDRLVNGSSVQDFAALTSLDKSLVPDRPVNESLPADAIRMLYLLDRHGPPTRASLAAIRARDRLVDLLRGVPRTPFRLDPGLVKQLVSRADVAWAESVTGFDLQSAAMSGGCDGSTADFSDFERSMEEVSPQAAAWLASQLERLRLRSVDGERVADRVVRLYEHQLTLRGRTKGYLRSARRWFQSALR